MKTVFIDSDIFVRDLRYPRDKQTEINKTFLNKVKLKKIRGCTSIFNLLEVAVIMSFNFSPDELTALYAGFPEHYNVQILFPADHHGNLDYDLTKIFMQIQKKQSLGDAQVASVVNRFSDKLECFVSWNARHFDGKVDIPVCTPLDYT